MNPSRYNRIYNLTFQVITKLFLPLVYRPIQLEVFDDPIRTLKFQHKLRFAIPYEEFFAMTSVELKCVH